MNNENKNKIYVGFYTSQENVEKLNLIAGAMYQNNRSLYLNDCLKKYLNKDYETAVNKIQDDSLERSQND